MRNASLQLMIWDATPDDLEAAKENEPVLGPEK